MAAAKGNQNSVGNSGGKSLNDRKLAAKVRTLALGEIQKVLSNPSDDKDLYKAVLIKLAGTVLPRINQHSGLEDDDGVEQPILVKFIDGKIENNTNTK
jgi:hypothetical protein